MRGLRIVDISGASEPEEISRFTDPEDAGALVTHTAWPTDELVDGRHLTVSGSLCDRRPSERCYVRVLDTTDPSQPEQITNWTLPDEVHGPAWTSEVLHVSGATAALPWKHGGLWTVDLSEPEQPRTTGYHFLAAEPLDQTLEYERPHARGAFALAEGPVVVADRGTGLWFLEPGGQPELDPTPG